MLSQKIFKVQLFTKKNIAVYDDKNSNAGDVLCADNSNADPNYLPDEQSSDSELDLRQDTDDKEYDSNTDNNITSTADETTKKAVRMHLRNCNQWKSTKRSLKTLAGEAHTSKTGNLVSKKTMKPACRPCKKKCHQKVDENLRKEIFNGYWDPTKNWDVKRQFIISHVASKPIDRVRSKDNSRSGKKNNSI